VSLKAAATFVVPERGKRDGCDGRREPRAPQLCPFIANGVRDVALLR
jgi:hypothetical protein